jgi:hypothetical protein
MKWVGIYKSPTIIASRIMAFIHHTKDFFHTTDFINSVKTRRLKMITNILKVITGVYFWII